MKVPKRGPSKPTVPVSAPPPEYLQMAAAQMAATGRLGQVPTDTLPQILSVPNAG